MKKNQKIADLIAKFGGQVKLGEALKVSQGTVTGWLNMKHGINSINAQKIEKLTAGEFKAVDLCPRLAEIEAMDEQPKTPNA